MKSVLVLAALVIPSVPTIAAATPHVLPFTYPYETLPADQLEVEQYVDLVPVLVEREQDDGTVEGVYGISTTLQTEFEFGITDRLEAGFYFQFRQFASAGAPSFRFDGIKQRLHYRIAEADDLPVNIGLYLELSEFQNELELEEKLLLAKRIGDFNLMANLWVEQEWYWQTKETKYIYNPTAGISYEVSTKVAVGLEYWARGRFDKAEAVATSDTPIKTHHYLGPTFLLQSGKVSLSAGVYLGLDKLGDTQLAGDQFGKLWFRTIVGIDL